MFLFVLNSFQAVLFIIPCLLKIIFLNYGKSLHASYTNHISIFDLDCHTHPPPPCPPWLQIDVNSVSSYHMLPNLTSAFVQSRNNFNPKWAVWIFKICLISEKQVHFCIWVFTFTHFSLMLNSSSQFQTNTSYFSSSLFLLFHT